MILEHSFWLSLDTNTAQLTTYTEHARRNWPAPCRSGFPPRRSSFPRTLCLCCERTKPCRTRRVPCLHPCSAQRRPSSSAWWTWSRRPRRLGWALSPRTAGQQGTLWWRLVIFSLLGRNRKNMCWREAAQTRLTTRSTNTRNCCLNHMSLKWLHGNNYFIFAMVCRKGNSGPNIGSTGFSSVPVPTTFYVGLIYHSSLLLY